MSQISKAIQHVEHDLDYLDNCERIVGELRPELAGRREQQRRRLVSLYEQREAERQWERNVLASFRRDFGPCEAPRSILVALGADEHVGTGRNKGFAMEGVFRTRRI